MESLLNEAPPDLACTGPQLQPRRELLARLRRTNPDLTVVWLPPVVLVPLSWFAIAIQKVLRPRHPAINVAKVFAQLRYDTLRITELAPAIRAEAARRPNSNGAGPTAIAIQNDGATIPVGSPQRLQA